MDRGTVGSAQSGRLLVEVREEGSSAVVTPAGELDHHTAELLREPLDDCLAKGFSRLVVDCARLDFCDSTGLNVLLGARLKAEAAGGGVHLAGMQPVVARVFEITGAEAVFTVHDTVEAALAAPEGAGGTHGPQEAQGTQETAAEAPVGPGTDDASAADEDD
ncbi:anti-sigma factor antagonist [Streptomyces griseosporeus]|nr:anti-sigma factor antagonist [Streptomyces griseosporeus]